MKRNSAQRNLESLSIVATRLEELRDEVTFVGGCITGLLITDIAAPDVRFTKDVDCIINIITLYDYHGLEDKLRQKGFNQSLHNNDPICRWYCDDIMLDVMPVDHNVLGFSNRWYKESLSHAIKKTLNNVITISILSAPYFLATKLEAFKDRGKNDYLLSHDLEDIISLIDGRPEIVDDVIESSNELKKYLTSQFSNLMKDDHFLQALPGHLNYSNESDERKKILTSRINKMINQIEMSF